MAGISDSSVKLKSNPPECYGGRRDYLEVHTWLYKVEQYFEIMSLFNPGLIGKDGNRVLFASTFLTGTAAVWWYTLVRANRVPITWDAFCAALKSEFVPSDHPRLARDKLRKLKQLRSVAK